MPSQRRPIHAASNSARTPETNDQFQIVLEKIWERMELSSERQHSNPKLPPKKPSQSGK